MRKFLIVEDDPTLQFVLRKILSGPECELIQAADGTEALERMRHDSFDVILSDLRMEPMDGFALLQALPESAAHTPFIVMTAVSDVTSAAKAMKMGAFDYVVKPLNISALKEVLRRAIDMRSRSLLLMGGSETQHPELSLRFGRIVALSPATGRACDLVEQIAHTRASLVLCGESGVGRTLLACAAHDLSECPGPALQVDLAAPADCAGREADEVKRWMEGSQGGTLILRHVDQMTLPLQQALLEWHLSRAQGPKSSDTHRIISTTATPLGEWVDAGQFLSPLAHWMGLIHVSIAPLRQRREDLTGFCRLALARHDAQSGTSHSFDTAALAALESYGWPGNFNELQEVLSECLRKAGPDRRIILKEDLPAHVRAGTKDRGEAEDAGGSRGHAFQEFLRKKEAERILKIIQQHGGDLAGAAQATAIPLATLERIWRESRHAGS
ncbi:MAG: sigma-54-dependent Fis family transcriptional regulator [Kiritimatiellae bacterium]|nr:sigma-54-dependent Fis family transcriptional regulator [Kiritimatiellia bacterium]